MVPNHPTIMSFNHAEPEKVCNKFRRGPKPKSEAEVVAPDLFMKLACLYQQGPSARQVYFCYLKESLPKSFLFPSFDHEKFARYIEYFMRTDHTSCKQIIIHEKWGHLLVLTWNEWSWPKRIEKTKILRSHLGSGS